MELEKRLMQKLMLFLLKIIQYPKIIRNNSLKSLHWLFLNRARSIDKVNTTWAWMWHPQLYRTHQYTEKLELSLFVVLYADRIGVLGGYWIPESLVCHGHPPHGATPNPSHLTSSPQGPQVYRGAGVISLCCAVFSQNLTFSAVVICSGLVLFNKSMTQCLYKVPANMPSPPPPPLCNTG